MYVLGAAALLFAYVLLSFAWTVTHVGKHRWRLAQNGLIVAIAPPSLLFAAPIDLPGANVRTLLFGSLLWVTLAMAFAAFSCSRYKSGDRGDALNS
jgi:glucose dehydrogenase